MELTNKKILLGVTGGIAAYKACSIVNKLIAQGAEVRVVMTDSAKRFIDVITFQALTNHPVYDDLWQSVDSDNIDHISLSKWADIIVIAPATANTIAKIAHGLADNILTTVLLAKPRLTNVIIAPAMNTNMWNNYFVQENIKKIQKVGNFIFVEPRSGILACKDEGIGKIADDENIIEYVKKFIKHP